MNFTIYASGELRTGEIWPIFEIRVTKLTRLSDPVFLTSISLSIFANLKIRSISPKYSGLILWRIFLCHESKAKLIRCVTKN